MISSLQLLQLDFDDRSQLDFLVSAAPTTQHHSENPTVDVSISYRYALNFR